MQNATQKTKQKTHFFTYTNNELDSLKAKDTRLAGVVEKIGRIKREVDSDLIASVVHHIIAQQISTKAQESIWARFCDRFGAKDNVRQKAGQNLHNNSSKNSRQKARNLAPQSKLNIESLISAGVDNLRSCGVSARKAEYIIDFARKVQAREFDIERVKKMSDKEAIDELVKLRGIGVWTAEMILLFCLQRKDILSYDDLALQRALKLLYGINGEGKQGKIPKNVFETYRAKFSPYDSIASLYLWEIASTQFEV